MKFRLPLTVRTWALIAYSVLILLALVNLLSNIGTLTRLAPLAEAADQLGISTDEARQRLLILIPLAALIILFCTVNLMGIMSNFKPILRVWPVAPVLAAFYAIFQIVSALLLSSSVGLWLVALAYLLLGGAAGVFTYLLLEPAKASAPRKPRRPAPRTR